MRLAANEDLRAKVCGRATYAQDLIRPGMAVVGVVRSTAPHARIVSIDTSSVRQIPGVLGVLTAADFSGFLLGAMREDQPVLATDVVRYVGEPVVAIAAEDREALRRAISSVRVGYEPLPAVLTPEAALAAPQPIHPSSPDNVAVTLSVDHGDWDAAVEGVVEWVEDEFVVQAMQHGYMEPYAGVATFERACITLRVPVHSPHQIRDQYLRWAERWGDATIEIEPPVIGGSFGAKYEHPLHLIAAEFAHRMRRDVGFVLSRREDFLQGTPRVDMRLGVRIGASRNGDLLVKQTEVLADNGAYSLDAPYVFGAAAIRIDNLYRFRAVRASGKLVYTNRLPTQCFRGFGSPQAAFAQEQLVDEIARRLGMSPFELRRRNAVRDGDTTIHGWKIGACGFVDCLDTLERAGSEQEQGRLGTEDGRYVVGHGVAAGTHVISNRSAAPADGDRAVVRLRVKPDGRLDLLSSEVEIGAGTVGIFASLIAGELAVSPSDVEVHLGDTASAPFGLGSFASRTTFFAGNAILDAAARLRERAAVVRENLGTDASAGLAAVAAAAQEAGCLDELDVVGEYLAEGVEPHDPTWFGNVSPSYTFGVHACTVRVDTWTGRIEVLRYRAAHDAGTILNDAAARGQVYGGVLQGLGYALSEEVVVDEGGNVLNPGFLDYRIPTFLDRVPVEIWFAKTYDRTGPLGAKSIAEPPIIPVAACVANAIRDATGTRPTRLPMQPETVYRVLHGH